MNIRKVLKLYQGCFKEVSRVFQDSFWDASRKIEGCFNGILSWFQGCLIDVSMVSQGNFKGV